MPDPDGRGQVLDADHHADEAVLPGRVVRGPQLQRHLVLVAEVHPLHVPAAAQVPEVQRVPVLAAQQQLADDAVLHHRRRAPLGGDQYVLGQVPPEVVRQVLRAAVGLPRPAYLERGVVEHRDAARSVSTARRPVGIRGPQGRQIDPIRSTVYGVRAGVAGVLGQLLGAEHLDHRRLARVGFGVQHMDARGAQPGHDQVTPLDVRVRGGRAERAAARVPPEVVQLVAWVGQVGPADHATVRGRGRVHVDHGDRVRPGRGTVERGDVRQLFGGPGGRLARRRIERGVRFPQRHLRKMPQLSLAKQ